MNDASDCSWSCLMVVVILGGTDFFGGWRCCGEAGFVEGCYLRSTFWYR